ncbi:ABC transporter permease [Mucilaginibacter sp.]|uniref:ABC transporter permease n=1 Tax=Mucilaginibacter sp. TaxID=1882438 RepID=UPI00283DC05B|nr:ABC transporter permease [Mucilaginibacter sp.]MDR3693714.1 ABC transporter permease [Mucilaginibacter sp.]
MIRNYVKTAFRSLMKNKGFTFINVLGLALGLATCLLIVFYVFDELSYDRYNVKADRIYRLNNDIKFGGLENSYAITPAPAAAALKGDFPEIEQVARLRNRGGNQVKKGTQDIQEDRMVYADNSIFDIFTLPMIAGNPARALVDPHTMVITEDMARKYFGRVNVIGQVLTINDSVQFKVTGVIKNIPKQSHFHFDFYMSMPTIAESKSAAWFSNNFGTYILLKPGADPKVFAAKLNDFMARHAGSQLQAILHMDFKTLEKSGSYFRLSIIPLTKIHLQSNSVDEIEANGSISYVYIFSATAIFILLIACVNFMNLSTARSANRAREVGVRKVLGSPRSALIAQFLTESILVTLVGAIIAVLAAWSMLGLFNQMSGKDLTVTPQILGWLIPALLIIILVVGCLAGSYPALFLSGFQPIKVLKGKLAGGFKGGMLRSILVVVQFTISIILIVSTMVISNQLKYIQSKDLGYNRDHVLVIKNVWALGNAAKTFKQEVRQLAGVQGATLSNALPTDENGNSTTYFKDPVIDQKRSVLTFDWNIDEDFIPTLGIKMAAGRNFSKDMATDSTGIVINEAFAKQLGYANPVNQFLYTPADQMATKTTKYHIIGVVKDFNFKSLRTNVTPLVFVLDQNIGDLSVRINSADIPSLMAKIKDQWKGLSPNRQFSYVFMDDNFDALYRSEERMGAISIAFTSLAIVIACLGLFGLAAYAAEQRIKEIGIRKVLGADISTIVNMLSKDFIKLVLIAIAIAVPFAWWAMHGWLQGFAYKQNIQWWVPATAGVSAILIAFLTISFQAIKAALTNPVTSLRSE